MRWSQMQSFLEKESKMKDYFNTPIVKGSKVIRLDASRGYSGVRVFTVDKVTLRGVVIMTNKGHVFLASRDVIVVDSLLLNK